jgi:hypothetical protein
MKYQRHIYGKRQVVIAGHIYLVQMEKAHLAVHRKYQREWVRVPLAKVVGFLLGILPME